MSDLPPISTPDQFMQAVRAAIGAGDIGRAGYISGQALDAGFVDPLFHKMRGVLEEGRGQMEAAAADFRAAVDMVPSDAAALNALGLCLGRLGRAQEALIELDRALQANPGFAAAASNKGWVLELLGDLDGARAAYAEAASMDQANPTPLANIASIAARTGDRDTARRFAEQALVLDPAEPTAAMAMAIVQTAEGDAEAARARLEQVLATPERLAPQSRAVALGLMGDALDGLDRTTEAFAAWREENAGQRALFAGRFAPGRPESGGDYVRRLSAFLEASEASDWREPIEASGSAYPGPAKRHVFLLGFPRSGTTLLGQVLAAHPEVETLDERENLIDAVQAYMLRPEDLQALKGLPSSQLDTHRDLYWRRVREAGAEPGGKVFVDKLPMNTLKLPLIARMFPEATILFARRDPRDVVLSCFRRHFVINPTTWEFTSLEGAARYYDAVAELVLIMQERLPIDLRPQRHEGLIEDFEGQSKALCKTLGLPWREEMADFAERSRGRGISTPSAAQVRAGLSSRGVGEWKRYADELAPVLPILAPWVERYGYPAE